MRILITGINGFVGSNLSDYLAANGYEILTTDISNAQVTGDLTDPKFVLQNLSSHEFDAIVHLAGLISVPMSIDDPYACFRINCFGTLNLLKMADQKKLKRFIYISSNNVYGSPTRLPVREDYPFQPRAPYDYSKVIGEYLASSFHNARRVPTVILRSWKMFGPHDVPTAAVPRFIEACLTNQPIPLYNGGRDTNDVYHVKNFCAAVALALKEDSAIGETFNVGTGNEISVRELAGMVKQLTNSRSKVQLLPPRTPTEKTPMKTRPSIRKIKQVLGYRPVVNLRLGLEQTIQWYRERFQATAAESPASITNEHQIRRETAEDCPENIGEELV